MGCSAYSACRHNVLHVHCLDLLARLITMCHVYIAHSAPVLEICKMSGSVPNTVAEALSTGCPLVLKLERQQCEPCILDHFWLQLARRAGQHQRQWDSLCLDLGPPPC